MGKAPISWLTIRRLALALPDVEDATSYGTPALKVKGVLMVRLREDGDVVFVAGFDKRDLLMVARPEAFFTTDHYRDYPSVLARLRETTESEIRDLLQWSWELAREEDAAAQALVSSTNPPACSP
jgi:hypothetical protein